MPRALACNTGRYSATAKRPLPDRAAERLDRFVGIGAETGVRVAVAEAEHAAAHPVARALERVDRTRIAELDELRDRGLAIGARLAVLEVEQRRLERGVAIDRRLDRRQERRWWWWWRIVADVVAIGPIAIRIAAHTTMATSTSHFLGNGSSSPTCVFAANGIGVKAAVGDVPARAVGVDMVRANGDGVAFAGGSVIEPGAGVGIRTWPDARGITA